MKSTLKKGKRNKRRRRLLKGWNKAGSTKSFLTFQFNFVFYSSRFSKGFFFLFSRPHCWLCFSTKTFQWRAQKKCFWREKKIALGLVVMVRHKVYAYVVCTNKMSMIMQFALICVCVCVSENGSSNFWYINVSVLRSLSSFYDSICLLMKMNFLAHARY